MSDSFTADPDRLARFQREAEVLAALNSPHIAHIHGIEDSDGVRALVLEFVDGPTLAARIAQGPIPLDEAVPIARQIAEALETAHEQSIIHRDLKPANVKVRADGTVKVLDFGLAKAMEPVGGASNFSQSPTITTPGMMTGRGVILGTAAYMAPERARGRPVDRRADLWAFGAVLYEMLTGATAFRGDNVSEILAHVLTKEPDWARLSQGTPEAIRRLLRRCLEKDPDRRLDSAAAARLELEDAVTAPVGPTYPMTWPPKTRLLAAAIAGVVTGLVLAAAITWMLMRQPPPLPSQPSRFVIVPSPRVPLVIGQWERSIAVSADGRYLAYPSWGYIGEGSLILRALDQLDAQPVAGAANARDPFFSPDGRWIGFFDRNLLKKALVAGGAAITICRNPGGFGGSTWLDDDTIVFGANGAGVGLFRVPASGGEPTAMTTPDVAHGEREHVLPFALPGGRGVLFTVVAKGGGTHVAVIDLQNGRYNVLVRGASDAQYIGSWSGSQQDGYLVYAVNGAIRGVRFDLTRLVVLSDPLPLVDSVEMAPNGHVGNYAVSRTGSLFYVPGGTNMRSLVWVDRKGRETEVPAPPRPYVKARLSPDGRRAALEVESEIWIWHFARASLMRLTPSGGFPAWTPDSRRVMFNSRRDDSDNSVGVYRQAADGSGTLTRITTSIDSLLPNSVTPDGQHLLGSRHTDTTVWDVVLFPLAEAAQNSGPNPSEGAASKLQSLVETPAAEYAALTSPDEHYLAYQSNETGRFEIYVRPFFRVNDGRWQISTSGGGSPAWSRTGRELFYLDGAGNLMAAPIEPSAKIFTPGIPTRIFDAQNYYRNLFAYDVQPDGQRFLMLKESRHPNVVVVLDWVEELKRLMPTK